MVYPDCALFKDNFSQYANIKFIRLSAFQYYDNVQENNIGKIFRLNNQKKKSSRIV